MERVVDGRSGEWKQWWMEAVVDGSSGGWKQWWMEARGALDLVSSQIVNYFTIHRIRPDNFYYLAGYRIYSFFLKNMRNIWKTFVEAVVDRSSGG